MSYAEEKLTTLGHLKELAQRVEQDFATKEALEEATSGQLTEDNAMSVVDIIKILEV